MAAPDARCSLGHQDWSSREMLRWSYAILWTDSKEGCISMGARGSPRPSPPTASPRTELIASMALLGLDVAEDILDQWGEPLGEMRRIYDGLPGDIPYRGFAVGRVLGRPCEEPYGVCQCREGEVKSIFPKTAGSLSDVPMS